MAYSPNFENGILKKIFRRRREEQHPGQLWNVLHGVPGLDRGIMYGVPPFGYNYLSPAPPLFATPFINAGERRREHRSVSVELPAA